MALVSAKPAPTLAWRRTRAARGWAPPPPLVTLPPSQLDTLVCVGVELGAEQFTRTPACASNRCALTRGRGHAVVAAACRRLTH